MTGVPFTHLHVHTDASLKDGLGTVHRLVGHAKERGFDSLAMTDHGSLANAVAFTIACKAAGIKPILGVEGYIAVDEQVGHITLLADGDAGFANIVKLNNLGHASSFKRPAFTVDQLLENADGVVCLSGCVSSPLQSMPYEEAKRLAARMKSVFGPRFFMEVMFIADQDTWSRPIRLAEEIGSKVVLTNDVHFPLEHDASIHAILTQMKAGFEYNSRELWLKTPDRILSRAVKAGYDHETVKEWIFRAHRIARLITPVNLEKEPHLPHVEDAEGKLKTMVIAALKARKSELVCDYKKYVARAQYELKIINSMGYATYFVILDDIVQNAKERGVRVGPGRGSGAASVVLYLLGITDVDPILYDLSFERFLNPERRGMPDVDMDFDSEHRKHVIEYAESRWNAIPIATYSKYSHKILVHDLAKMLKIPRDIEKVAADMGPESAEFKNLCEANTVFCQAYDAFKDQIRHKGKHAGGVIITPGDVPVERVTNDQLAAAWTEGKKNELSYAGIVKFDLLGLSALSAIRRLEKKYGRRADRPEDDHPAFEIFQKGDLAGIFQFSGSSGIRELTLKLQPRVFDELTAINALYRPGALDVGAVDAFPKWKKEPRRVPALIEDILAPTYGAIVYQEQVMAIYARITNGTLGEADLARRVIVKSKRDDPEWVKKFEALQAQFVEASIKAGLSEKESKKLWEELAAHSRYSFNKGHATAYAYVAWETAWWKFTHPAAFYAAMLNTDPSETQTYIIAAVESGIIVSPPHVNSSTEEWEADEKTIYMPLTSIKHLGTPGATAIVAARDTVGGKFADLKKFMEVVPKKLLRARGREGLWFLGAFRGIEGVIEDLQMKKEVASKSVQWYEAQRTYLGFVIPKPSMLKEFKRLEGEGFVAGIIAERKAKESKFGPYIVYHLMPRGTFWSRERMDLQVGEAVAAKVNKNSGKARAVEMI